MRYEERSGEEEEQARDGDDGELLTVDRWPRTGGNVNRARVGDEEGEEYEESVQR